MLLLLIRRMPPLLGLFDNSLGGLLPSIWMPDVSPDLPAPVPALANPVAGSFSEASYLDLFNLQDFFLNISERVACLEGSVSPRGVLRLRSPTPLPDCAAPPPSHI